MKTLRNALSLALLSGTVMAPMAAEACPRQAAYIAASRHVVVSKVQVTRVNPVNAVIVAGEQKAGKLLAINGAFLGHEHGLVKLTIQNVTFESDVKHWANDKVVVQLPNVQIAEAVIARFELYRADGRLMRSGSIRVLPAIRVADAITDEELSLLISSKSSSDASHSVTSAAAFSLVASDGPAIGNHSQPALPEVETGRTLRLKGQLFGQTAGSATLEVGGVPVPAKVVGWQAKEILVTLPKLTLDRPTTATLTVLKPDGSLAKSLDFALLPTQDFEEVGVVGEADLSRTTAKAQVSFGEIQLD